MAEILKRRHQMKDQAGLLFGNLFKALVFRGQQRCGGEHQQSQEKGELRRVLYL